MLHYTNYITLHPTALHYSQLHYTQLHYNSTTSHYTQLHYATPHLQLQPQPQLQLQYATLHYTGLHYITLRHITLRWAHYTSRINCKCTTLITCTPQLQLHCITTTTTAALHHTASSSCGWSDSIATAPKNTTPTTFKSISGFAVAPVNHNNQPLL